MHEMLGRSYSDEEIKKFLMEILQSELALEIFQQLKEDGGNTVQGLIESLNKKGIKTAKTSVYEEMNKLTKKGIIKRISKRPPIYTLNLEIGNFEELSKEFFMETREELMRRWAASYPFLPDDLKHSERETKSFTSVPMVNFNPYPIVDLFNMDEQGLQRYLLRVFESNIIQISNTTVDVCLSSENFRAVMEKDNFNELYKTLQRNYNQNGRILLKTLTQYQSPELKLLSTHTVLPDFYKKFFRFFDYEVRTPVDNISSFVIGNNNILFPIGIGALEQKTYIIIEIRDQNIIKKAQISFNKAWNNALPVFKVIDGKPSL
ncbi:MAG: hypothetical protein ACFFDW_08775 [Candidatus Thorarchaeota archaeon]